MDPFKKIFMDRIKDQFVQGWQSYIKQSRKCVLYKNVKEDFMLERYLCEIPWKFSKYILKLRLCNHKLAIETGRYYNIERNDRKCDKCSMDLLGDEFHLFF